MLQVLQCMECFVRFQVFEAGSPKLSAASHLLDVDTDEFADVAGAAQLAERPHKAQGGAVDAQQPAIQENNARTPT